LKRGRNEGTVERERGFGAFRPCQPQIEVDPAPFDDRQHLAAELLLERRQLVGQAQLQVGESIVDAAQLHRDLDPRSFGSALAVPCHGADHERPGLDHT
jgi:hypothetical protein